VQSRSPNPHKELIAMQTTELSLRAQTILEHLEEVLVDLVLELRKDYQDVEVRVSISAR
jgi:hypothetical protein